VDLCGQVSHPHADANGACALAGEQAFLPLYEGDAVRGVQQDDAGHLRDDDLCLYWDPF
jgi:hypothetical protein